jgi:O-antigen ligase
MNNPSRFSVWVNIVGIAIGLVAGVLAGLQPLVLGAILIAVPLIICFFGYFEQTVLGLLILRSSLDVFSEQQIPAVFAVAIDILTLSYLAVLLLKHKTIKTDWFWWFLAAWVLFQGLWLILLPLGGLGLDASVLSDSIREWIRLFSWVMIYLLILQLQAKISPEKIIKTLFWALIIPLSIALLQLLFPAILPSIFSPTQGNSANLSEGISRINGTLGHSNTFTSFILLFISLSYWQLQQSSRRWLWLSMLAILAFFLVSTKALFGLMMLTTFVLIVVAPKLNPVTLIGGILLIVLVVFAFASSDFGQERLGSLSNTPLLNPDMDIWHAIILSRGDENSFNWRLSQWQYLLEQWRQHPLLGYGLGVSIHVSNNHLYPHNDYIRALVEGGIVGFISFISLLFMQVFRLIQLWQNANYLNTKQRDLCLVLLAFLGAMTVGMITENIWSHTTLFFYWWTLLALVGFQWSKKPTKTDDLTEIYGN